MRDFRNLKTWEESHDLTLRIYECTSHFPDNEAYGLTSQIRRACASIPTNIAEGCGRGGSVEFNRFLQIAMGSASETEYLLLLSHDLKYIQDKQYKDLINQTVMVKKMLASLIKKIQTEG